MEMIDIRNLLTQVSLITKKNNEILDSTGGRFNMFGILGVNHYENTHSAIICEFLNPKGSHGLKDQLLKSFIENLSLNDQKSLKFKTETAEAITEHSTLWGRIDILIEDKNGHAIIIENKIYAEDQQEQLSRYNEFALNKYGAGNYLILYLTLYGTEASEQSCKDIDYIKISHSEFILKWLERCVSHAVRFPLVRETINQYINHLKELTNQSINDKMSNEISNIILNNDENLKAAFQISKSITEVKNELLKQLMKEIENENRVSNSLKCVKSDLDAINKWKAFSFTSDKLTEYNLDISFSFELSNMRDGTIGLQWRDIEKKSNIIENRLEKYLKQNEAMKSQNWPIYWNYFKSWSEQNFMDIMNKTMTKKFADKFLEINAMALSVIDEIEKDI